MVFHRTIILCAALLHSGVAWAGPLPSTEVTADATLTQTIKSELSKRYPGSRVDLGPSIRWTRGGLPSEISGIAILEESPRGEVRVEVRSSESMGIAEGWVSFSAWTQAYIASRRILPGEKLDPSVFILREVNVATGPHRETRGLIVSQETEISSLETRQTILEGTALLSNAIQRIPDVRRGDSVRIHLFSNGVVLSVQGIAQEPAYLKGRIRVMTDKTKRELVGSLESGGIVEVKL